MSLTPETVRAITIRQPWATAIAHGTKRVENRSKHWTWRGLLLIHTAKAVDRPALHDPLVATAIRGHDLETGAVIAVARLADCHPDCHDSADGPCSPWAQRDAHHLVLAEVQALTLPLPCIGALGPWRPPQSVLDQVLLQLPDLRA
ncbi:ASCH domain-containing protein [Streptomyces odonnellii]|uniref:ASCH domain-containing protein n=1 Tax=Streptomyces odonnellii TaxID=1417980 RepID=UPI000625AE19|nr:ASCH domain-containing protein [Streptomyces odonnellii]